MTVITSVLHNAIVRGAISGLLAAAVVDLHAFMRWKNVHDAVTYDWNTALLRWAQGLATGALSAAGLGMVL